MWFSYYKITSLSSSFPSFHLPPSLPPSLPVPLSLYLLLPPPPTQSDMADKREVSYGEGDILARSLKCPFFETSAKLRVNIDDCFHELVREIKKAQQEKNKEQNDKGKSKKGCIIL